MDVLETIANRHSYRGAFKPIPVPKEHLRQIVQAGLQAPSASNTQTTSYVIVDDPAALARLAEIIPTSVPIKTAPAVIVVLVDGHDPQSERADFGPVNYGASVENVLLAATGLGYGTLWMEGWKRTAGAVDAVAALLGVPDELVVTVLIPLGVRADDPGEPRAKRPFEERAWWNKVNA
jgi:nitroreductase